MKCKDCKYYIQNPIFKTYYRGWCKLLDNLKINGDIEVNCEYYEEIKTETT